MQRPGPALEASYGEGPTLSTHKDLGSVPGNLQPKDQEASNGKDLLENDFDLVDNPGQDMLLS